MATKQIADAARSKQGAGASQIAYSIGGAGEKSHGKASSPNPDRRRGRIFNTKKMMVYDPFLAAKQKAMLNNVGRRSQGQATEMPETVMLGTAKPGKIIAQQERRMPVGECHHRNIQESEA
jgi:hypothetical protein